VNVTKELAHCHLSRHLTRCCFFPAGEQGGWKNPGGRGGDRVHCCRNLEDEGPARGHHADVANGMKNLFGGGLDVEVDRVALHEQPPASAMTRRQCPAFQSHCASDLRPL